MYRELIEKLIEGHSWAKLQAPCSEKDITKAEKFVGFSFPEELKALLRETNGDRNFLLSAEEIISNTKNNREIFPEFLEAEEYEEKVNRFVFFRLYLQRPPKIERLAKIEPIGRREIPLN